MLSDQRKIAKNFRKVANVINDSQQDSAVLQLAEPDVQMIFETLKLKHHFLPRKKEKRNGTVDHPDKCFLFRIYRRFHLCK